ncbi:MAG: response regulator [Planctomycetota bacterium JB042]
MRLEEMTLSRLRRAVELYLELAYVDAPRPASLPIPDWASLPPSDPVSSHLDLFLDESSPSGVRCFALRLGNARYRFMKLRLLEYLYRDEFFLTVDTHDQMFESAGDPALARLMAFNRELKQAIEASWEGAALPTTVNLKGLSEGTPVEPEPRKGIRILLVEDDPSIQETVERLLDVKGYDVDLACDGREAVGKADPARHALVLMDVEMPRMSGIEAMKALRDDPTCHRLPVLLMTAGAVPLAQAEAGTGFLVKPFRADELFRFLDLQLERNPSS